MKRKTITLSGRLSASLVALSLAFQPIPAYALRTETAQEAGLEETLTQALKDPAQAFKEFTQEVTGLATSSAAGLEENTLTAQEGKMILTDPLKRQVGETLRLTGEVDLARLFGRGIPEGYHSVFQPLDPSLYVDKDVLVVPGYGNVPFLIRELGARSVLGVDLDPATVAWQKARALYGRDSSVAKQLTLFDQDNPVGFERITGTPPPFDRIRDLVRRNADSRNRSLDRIRFAQGSIRGKIPVADGTFDLVVVPYLFGVPHGVDDAEGYLSSLRELLRVTRSDGTLAIFPARVLETGEFASRINEFHEWLGEHAGLFRKQFFQVRYSRLIPLMNLFAFSPVLGYYARIDKFPTQTAAGLKAETQAESQRLREMASRLADDRLDTKALQAIERAYALDQRDPEILTTYANLLTLPENRRMQGALKRAEGLARAVLELRPNHAKALTILAEALSLMDRHGEAEETILYAISLGSENIHSILTATQVAVHIFNHAGDHDKALEIAQPALRLEPETPEDLLKLAQIHHDLKSQAEALKILHEEILRVNPGWFPALELKREIQRDQRRLAAGLEEERSESVAQPSDWDSLTVKKYFRRLLEAYARSPLAEGAEFFSLRITGFREGVAEFEIPVDKLKTRRQRELGLSRILDTLWRKERIPRASLAKDWIQPVRSWVDSDDRGTWRRVVVKLVEQPLPASSGTAPQPSPTAGLEEAGQAQRIPVKGTEERLVIFTPATAVTALEILAGLESPPGKPLQVAFVVADSAQEAQVRAGLEQVGLAAVEIVNVSVTGQTVWDAVADLQIRAWSRAKQLETFVVDTLERFWELGRWLEVPRIIWRALLERVGWVSTATQA